MKRICGILEKTLSGKSSDLITMKKSDFTEYEKIYEVS